ncbi:hypothetical protein, partial [Eikenella corrodens]|uniref:hypothetical protein n=1 Tax=Eikenella corrodens TaxID=539 RepID=UPI00195ABAB7
MVFRYTISYQLATDKMVGKSPPLQVDVLSLTKHFFQRGCTRLADMLPSKYEDNTLQIKEEST